MTVTDLFARPTDHLTIDPLTIDPLTIDLTTLGSVIEPTYPNAETAAVSYAVRLSSGEVVTVVGANAYQPEGAMTTFFSTGSTRATIDSWSVRIASFRTNDIVSVLRH